MNDVDSIAAVLPPIETWPKRVRALPLDARGFPIPWFVAWFREGVSVPPRTPLAVPDFRVADPRRKRQAIDHHLCWICGEQLGRHFAFVIGPMCAVNMTTAEPPSHCDCAEFAARACPFLTRPRMRRNEKGLPEERNVPGHMIERNPGVVLVWTTRRFKPFQADTGGRGTLIEIGPATQIAFYAQGRLATAEEVREAIDSGLLILRDMARRDGPQSERDLEERSVHTLGKLEAHL